MLVAYHHHQSGNIATSLLLCPYYIERLMMETPLLASQHDAFDSQQPLLSSGPYIEGVDDPSPLERIIAESSGVSMLMRVGEDRDNAIPVRVIRPQLPLAASAAAALLEAKRHARCLVSVLAGSLWLLHCGLVWGSYVTDSWSDTHLRVSVDWSFYPNARIDMVLRSMNLASIFAMLKSSKEDVLLWLVFLSTLVVPCMMTLLFPMWIINDHCYSNNNNNNNNKATSMQHYQLARLAVESCIRLGFAVVYHFLLLDLIMYPLEWNWTGTTVQILNQPRGGLIAYVLGISSALLVIIVLRAAKSDFPLTLLVRVDVPEEDHHPSGGGHHHHHTNERAMDVVMINGDANFDLYAIDHDAVLPPPPRQSHFWLKRFLALQIGLISFLLWIPAMLFPLFRVSYRGLTANLMKSRSMQVYLWNIPYMLWTRGVAAGTDQWMLLVLGVMLVFSVFLLPFMAWLLASSFWVVSDISKSQALRRYLFLVHPATCGIMFAVVSIQTIRQLSILGAFLFDEVTSATVCKYTQSVMDEPCLAVAGELNAGIWFFLAQAILLETFVWVTLSWSH